METMDSSLIRMLIAGPEVSLKGSPTVSPTTAALWFSLPLPAQIASLDVLLGVIPSTTGVGHHNSQSKTSYSRTSQHTGYTLDAQDQTNYQRSYYSQDCRRNHFLLSRLGAEVYAAGVVRHSSTFHQARDFLELTAYFLNNALCSSTYRLHAEGSKYEGQHTADESYQSGQAGS